FVLEHRADIGCDPAHGAGADRLDTGLLDGVEDRTRLLALRRKPGVNADVVAGAPQRHGVAQTPGYGYVLGRRPLRPVPEPRAVAGKRWLILGEADLQLMVARNGTHADADGTLEAVRLCAAARLAACIVARTRHGPRQLSTTLAADSG